MDNLYFNPRRLRKIKNKRSCRTMKIWGWILTALGGITILDGLGAMVMSGGGLANVFDGLFFLIPGAFLLLWARHQVGKWDRYESLIDNQGNTSIEMLTERMKLPEKTVYADLHKMIGNDFFIGPNFNIESYIDGERNMLVMMVGGKPLKPLPDIKKRPGEEGAAEEDRQDEKTQEEFKREPSIKVQMSDLDTIRRAIAGTSEDDVRSSLYGIEGSMRRIDERVQGDPGLRKKNSIRKLYKYYLPQIMDLIRQYQRPETGSEAKEQIKTALSTSAGALANIEADLLEKEQMDIEVDIQVLKNMFAQDGLLRDAVKKEEQMDRDLEVRTGASQ